MGVRNSYVPPGYIAEQCVMEFLYSPSAGTLSLRAARRDGTYLGDEGDNFREWRLAARQRAPTSCLTLCCVVLTDVVITDLPSEPLYVAPCAWIGVWMACAYAWLPLLWMQVRGCERMRSPAPQLDAYH